MVVDRRCNWPWEPTPLPADQTDDCFWSEAHFDVLGEHELEAMLQPIPERLRGPFEEWLPRVEYAEDSSSSHTKSFKSS